jgi:hypothetical protein
VQAKRAESRWRESQETGRKSMPSLRKENRDRTRWGGRPLPQHAGPPAQRAVGLAEDAGEQARSRCLRIAAFDQYRDRPSALD